jgi:hypothetical protein
MKPSELNRLQLNELIRTLEIAVARQPGQTWRYELLAAVYGMRAEQSTDVREIRSDLRAVERLRDEIERRRYQFVFGPPSDRDAASHETLDRVDSREGIVPLPYASAYGQRSRSWWAWFALN